MTDAVALAGQQLLAGIANGSGNILEGPGIVSWYSRPGVYAEGADPPRAFESEAARPRPGLAPAEWMGVPALPLTPGDNGLSSWADGRHVQRREERG